MKDRKIEWFSFVAILMVVLIHVKGTDVPGFDRMVQSVLKLVASIAVPFFFCVSGYMLARHVSEEGWWRAAVRKRLKTIVVPYLFWNVVAFLVLSSLRLSSNVLRHAELLRNIDPIWIVFGVDLTHTPANFPLWYMRTLMFFILICPPLVWLVRKSHLGGLLLVVGVFLLGNVLDCRFASPSPWYELVNFFFAPSCFVYFLAGIVLRVRPVSVNRAGSLVLSGLGLAIIVFSAYHGGYGIGFPKALSVTLFNLANVLLLSGIWGLIPNKQLPPVLVGQAMPIYVEHAPVLWILGNVFKLIVPQEIAQSTIWMLVRVLIFVLICMGLTKCLRRRFPSFSNLVFGGR